MGKRRARRGKNPSRKSKKNRGQIRKKTVTFFKNFWRSIRTWRGWKPLFRWTFKWGTIAGIWSLIIITIFVAYFAHDLPSLDAGSPYRRQPTITILANDGTFLARYGDFQGTEIQAQEVPPHLIHAILAIEDRRFYYHFGLDPFSLLRAVLANLKAGHVAQGGSTLTQQLAKNLFLTPERTAKRKVQEALLALQLEHRLTKNQILTAYLNHVYLGPGIYGFDAAARVYFDKPVTEVNLREAATLAGLLKAPARYSPSANPDQAEARTKRVLQAMVDAGFLTKADLANLNQIPMPPRRKPTVGNNVRYFTDWAADQAQAFAGYTNEDLVITTTLDPALQRLAEQRVATVLNERGDKARVSQAALVTMDMEGAIQAMVGGAVYQMNQFNRATKALRQPGSSFKPIVFLAGLESGLTPDTLVLDAPYDRGRWHPANFDGAYHGEVPLRDALAYSLNTAAVRVLEQTGIRHAHDLARRLGLTTRLNQDLGLALGTSEVTLLEMTGVYATFANLGHIVWPHAIQSIRTKGGRVLYQYTSEDNGQAASPEDVAQLNSMLTGVLTYGTGHVAQLNRPAAGKTGTSQDFRDAWFFGFTADLVTGVWMGNDDNRPMNKVTGGSLPAQIWKGVMQAAHAQLPVRNLPGIESKPSTEPSQPPTKLDDLIHQMLR